MKNEEEEKRVMINELLKSIAFSRIENMNEWIARQAGDTLNEWQTK